jgi:hypothetical protein
MEKSISIINNYNSIFNNHNRDNTLFNPIGHVRYISYRVKTYVVPVVPCCSSHFNALKYINIHNLIYKC